MYKKPQTAKLVDISKTNHNLIIYRVRCAIYRLLEEEEPINVTNVAKQSSVSRQNIYHNDELVKLIDYYGKYVQHSSFPENKKEYNTLYSVPDLQHIEESVEKLLEENRKLNIELFKLQNQIRALELGIEE